MPENIKSMYKSDILRKNLAFLMKPASYDCNLSCDYCFYKRTSESYPETGAHRMSMETFTALAEKAQNEERNSVSYIWQGGEPMLMGLDFYKKALEIQNKNRKSGQNIMNTVQTNGVLIDDNWANFFSENGMLIGISLDGPRELHDKHRFSRSGASFFDSVMNACDIMDAHKVEFNILTVVTKETADYPEEIYRFLKGRGFHYQQYIECVEKVDGSIAPFSLSPEKYGEFLCRLFDEWFKDGYPYTSIRFFDNLLQYYAGLVPECCMHKDDCGSYFVVEYNGDIYPCDFFVREEWKLGNIHENWIDEFIEHPLRYKFAGLRSLAHEKCESCQWLGFCLRGCPKLREFGSGGFDSLNYLCEGYKMFFEYSRDRYNFLTWDIMRRRKGLPVPVIPGRNDPCFCESGKKYKKCCEPYEFILKK